MFVNPYTTSMGKKQVHILPVKLKSYILGKKRERGEITDLILGRSEALCCGGMWGITCKTFSAPHSLQTF
jgi:hypothetical protein